MSKEWVIEKRVYKKSINKYFLNSMKLLIILLPILFIFSVFFILVGMLDDIEALDYGIPCSVFFVVFLFIIGINYVSLYITFKKPATKMAFKLTFEDDGSIRYFTDNSEGYQLINYKLYNFQNYYFIKDYNYNKIILIPKKEIEDVPELIKTVQENSSKKFFNSKCQKITFVLSLIIIFAILIMLTSKTTKEYNGGHLLQYAQNIEMVQECYPKDSIEHFTYISADFYYYNETYIFMPERKPEICIVSLQYDENNYKGVLNHLTIPNEYYYKANDYEFYLNSKSESFPQNFTMIILNESDNVIIFLGFNDKTNHYQKMIEEDFLKFINKVYGKYYDFNQ